MHTVLQISSSPKSPSAPNHPLDSPSASPAPKRKKLGTGSSSPKSPRVPDLPLDSPTASPMPKQKKLDKGCSSPKGPRVPDHPIDSPTTPPVSKRRKLNTGSCGKIRGMFVCYTTMYAILYAHGISTRPNIYLCTV